MTIEPNLMSIITSKINLTEFITYFDNIFDLFSITITCKDIYAILTNRKYLHLLATNNLNKLTNLHLDLSIEKFKINILKQLGLVLSGSTMLYSICGNNWGFHDNSIAEYENVFTENQLLEMKNSPNFNSLPDDYDLYIDPESIDLLPNNFNLIEYLKTQNIHLNYSFPECDEDIHYLIIHIRNFADFQLTKVMLSEITGMDVNADDQIHYQYNIEFLSKIFNSMFRHRKSILKTYSQLHDVNNEYYIKINVMKLFCKHPNTKMKHKMQLIFNNEVKSSFTNYDFKFLQSYLNPNDQSLDNNSSINFNNSLISIIHRNTNNISLPYKHISSSINPEKAVTCPSSINVHLAINMYSKKKVVQENIADIITTSMIRCLKYSSRGFNCMNNHKNYNTINLPNWYLTYSNVVTAYQKSNIRYFLKQVILLNEEKATATVYSIYKYGVFLFNNTILDYSYDNAHESLIEDHHQRLMAHLNDGVNDGEF